ncbi:hypothetical protein D9M72_303710 [compost metagenome]
MLASAQMQNALKPWTESGGMAQTQLNRLLGLGGVGSGGVTSMGLQTGLTPDQVRQQLMSRYTRQSTAPNAGPMYRTGQEAIDALGAQGANDYFQQQAQNNNGSWTQPGTGPGYWGNEVGETGSREWVSTAGDGNAGPTSTIDEEGLNAEIAKYYAEQKAQEDALKADPTYGSLMRAYRNGEEFSFTGKDLASDPGYQFGLDQGTQGIQRGQAARGNFLSGAAMKELDRFNQDYAGTKFDNAYNRNLNTWNTNLGAYNQNRGALYDMLSGVSRTGQNSAAQVGTSNITSANSIGNAMMGAGNAQAAGQVATTNGLLNGVNQAVNAFNTNNPNSAAGWNSLLSGGTTPYGASPTSVSGGASWVPNTNVFSGGNGNIF